MKLSGWQIIWIVVISELIPIIGLQITPAIQVGKQDAWLLVLNAAVLGGVLTFFIVRLGKLHPNQTLVPLSQAILGKWSGRIFVVPFFIAWYLKLAILLRSFGNFLQHTLLDRTPIWIILILLVILITYLTFSAGIIGIGRYCEIVGPIIIFVLISSLILAIGNFDWNNLQPVYSDSGWKKIIRGSLVPVSYFVDPFVFLVILALMQNPEEALSRTLIGFGINVFIVILATFMVIMVFGPNLAAKLRWPFFTAVRTIDILNFIQNIDVFIIFMWIFGVFGQLSIYMFILSHEIAQWSNVKNWKKIIWFIAASIFIIAILIPNEATVTLFLKYWARLIFPICGVVIPLFLLIITAIKKKVMK